LNRAYTISTEPKGSAMIRQRAQKFFGVEDLVEMEVEG
jgi:hypothetical protein